MQQASSSDHGSFRERLRRFDRICREVNVVLLVLAIGLAALDFTCFVALNIPAAIARAHAALPPTPQGSLFDRRPQAKPDLGGPFTQ